MAGAGLYDLVIAKVRKRIEEEGGKARPGYEREEAPKKRRLLQRSAIDTAADSEEALFGDAQTQRSDDDPALPPDHAHSTAPQPKGAAVVILAKRPTDPTSTSCISPAVRQPEATTALSLPESVQMKSVSENTLSAAHPFLPAILRHNRVVKKESKGADVVLLAKRPTDPTSTSCVSPAVRQPGTTEANTALSLPEFVQMKSVSGNTLSAAHPSLPAILRRNTVVTKESKGAAVVILAKRPTDPTSTSCVSPAVHQPKTTEATAFFVPASVQGKAVVLLAKRPTDPTSTSCISPAVRQPETTEATTRATTKLTALSLPASVQMKNVSEDTSPSSPAILRSNSAVNGESRGAAVRPTDPTSTSCISPAVREPETTEATTALSLTSTSCVSPAVREPETTEATTALSLQESIKMKIVEELSPAIMQRKGATKKEIMGAAERPSDPTTALSLPESIKMKILEELSPAIMQRNRAIKKEIMMKASKDPSSKPASPAVFLGLGQYRRLPRDIASVPGLYDLVTAEVMKQVKEECAKVTRLSFNSVLRKTSLQSLKTFSWDDVVDEWRASAPTFLKFLQSASSVCLAGPAARTTAQGKCKKRVAAMAGAMILHARSRKMHAPMMRNSLLLRHKGATKHCLRQFRTQGICVSQQETRRIVKEMGESYDKDLPEWKKDTLEGLFPEKEALIAEQEALIPEQEALIPEQEALIPEQEALSPEQEADVNDDQPHGFEGAAEPLQSFGSDHEDSENGEDEEEEEEEEDGLTNASAGQSDSPTTVPELIPSTSDGHSPIVQLNVGGCVFSTTLSTLRKQRGSRLAEMFGDGPPRLPTDAEGRHFVDRDGTHFGAILEFLRTDRLPAENIVEVHREAVHYGIKPLVRRLEQTPQFFGETVGRNRFISRVPNYKENIEVLIGAARAGAVGERRSAITVGVLRTEVDAGLYGNTISCPEAAVTFGPWEAGPSTADLLDCIKMDVEAQGYRVCIQPHSTDEDSHSWGYDCFYKLVFTWW